MVAIKRKITQECGSIGGLTTTYGTKTLA